ncbi:thioredoxin [Apostichopus japonicus]|uniref:Thioredoxin n=1 Tax=Stichopus japonicus TaxID=307972 RepID=A0A2G8L6Y7_STIJA|nr:thioredoxin [Apostichopus japonicus]
MRRTKYMCGPCRTIAPILDALVEEYDGQLKIYKMDVDANQDVPAKYGPRDTDVVDLQNGRGSRYNCWGFVKRRHGGVH